VSNLRLAPEPLPALRAIQAPPITPAPAITAGIDHEALVRHAQRVSHLMREVSAEVRRQDIVRDDSLADLLTLGIALSECVDLGVIHPGEAISWTQVARHAYPTGILGRYQRKRLHEAIKADTPRYDAPTGWRECPFPAPRGGTCRVPNKQWRKWVTNTVTGTWEHRLICPRHEAAAAARAKDVPPPAHNRGGILRDVFPDIDLDAIYRHVTPQWDPAVGMPEGGRPVKPKLELIVGGGL